MMPTPPPSAHDHPGEAGEAGEAGEPGGDVAGSAADIAARQPSELDYPGLQRWFLGHVVAPHRQPGGESLPGSGPDVGQVILPSRTLTAEQRLRIYSRMYFLRLRGVMKSDYEVVARLAGSDGFDELVRGYLERYPPSSYTLGHLGLAFPAYLARHTRRADAALLADVARLERALGDAVDTGSLGTVTADTLAVVPTEQWAEIRFRMDPSVRVMAFDHDACAIVNAHKAGRELPDLGRKRSWALVWRKDYTVWRQPLSEITYTILSALAAGTTIAVALERAAELVGDDGADELASKLFQWFSDWVSEGLFAVLVPPPAASETL